MAKLLARKFEKYLKLIFTDLEVDSRLLSGDVRLENVGVRCELLQELLHEVRHRQPFSQTLGGISSIRIATISSIRIAVFRSHLVHADFTGRFSS